MFNKHTSGFAPIQSCCAMATGVQSPVALISSHRSKGTAGVAEIVYMWQTGQLRLNRDRGIIYIDRQCLLLILPAFSQLFFSFFVIFPKARNLAKYSLCKQRHSIYEKQSWLLAEAK